MQPLKALTWVTIFLVASGLLHAVCFSYRLRLCDHQNEGACLSIPQVILSSQYYQNFIIDYYINIVACLPTKQQDSILINIFFKQVGSILLLSNFSTTCQISINNLHVAPHRIKLMIICIHVKFNVDIICTVFIHL